LLWARQAREAWKKFGRAVQMSAFLVEREPDAYARLETISARFPDISIKTYRADFLAVLPRILKDTPKGAFAFFFIDPKGWRIPLLALKSMLDRPNSEVIFNFMFDFINRAASINDPVVRAGLNELMPYGNWKAKLDEAERLAGGDLGPTQRKDILVGAFTESLARLGHYQYVAETTVLRSLRDAVDCLCYATRHSTGIQVFRDCQTKALTEQAKTRASAKVRHANTSSGQGEFFESLHDMGPNELQEFLQAELSLAERVLLDLTPQQPAAILYEKLWPQVLARHVVRKPDVNKIAAYLRKQGVLLFPDWEKGKHVPQPRYRTQRR
jgi:three-Cys-motif partner protein